MFIVQQVLTVYPNLSIWKRVQIIEKYHTKRALPHTRKLFHVKLVILKKFRKNPKLKKHKI